MAIVRIGIPILLAVLGAIIGTIVILVLSFRQQSFLNQKVSEYLQERNCEKGLPLPKNAG